MIAKLNVSKPATLQTIQCFGRHIDRLQLIVKRVVGKLTFGDRGQRRDLSGAVLRRWRHDLARIQASGQQRPTLGPLQHADESGSGTVSWSKNAGTRRQKGRESSIQIVNCVDPAVQHN